MRPRATGDPARPARALLPLRLFFGGTFLYAGFDKLLDPRFLDAASPVSIQAQMIGFTRTSPIAPLVRLGQPAAVPIGLAIAIAEIAIGLGALSGLAFRLAAWGGAALSLLFFLTASWSTRPFYIGADLPYAAGWIALALAGHGGLLVSRRFLDWASGEGGERPTASSTRPERGRRRPVQRAPAGPDALPVRDRRTVLQAGVLGLAALTAASLAVPFRLLGAERTESGGLADDASALPSSPGGQSPSAATASGSPSAGLAIATVADLQKTGARAFTVPFDAPAPFPAGDPAVIVKLGDGSFVAYDAVCTHAGCTVQWDRADRVLYCPCHGAAFDPADHAAVLDGPTNQPLAAIPILVDAATGTISLWT